MEVLVNERHPVPVGGRDWDRLLKLEYERQMLGRYVSDHPLSDCTHELDSVRYATLADLQDADPQALPDGTLVDTAGMLLGLHRRQRGKSLWLAGELEDEQRSVEWSMWFDAWKAHWEHVHPYRPVFVQATVKRQDDRPLTLVLQKVQLLQRHPQGCDCVVPPGEVSDPPAMTDEWRERLWRIEALHGLEAA